MQIKTKLLATNYFVDNKYLDKYCNLILANVKTKSIKFKTQRHHIIPKFVFKLNNINIDDSENNLVNLLYQDHCLAHYYLALCSCNNEIKTNNFLAIRHILGNKNLSLIPEEKVFIEQLPEYQQLYELSRQQIGLKHKGKIISEATREKERLAHLGKKYKSMSEQGKANIAAAHIGKSTGARPSAVKSKISATRLALNLTVINNGIEIKSVPEVELSKWLTDGWVLGTTIKPALGKITIIKNDSMKFIFKDELDKYLAEGWKRGRKQHSAETKAKIRAASIKRRGKKYLKWYNNGVIQIQAYDCPEGFMKGKLKNNHD